MAFNQNYYLTWENGELVTADTMIAFSDGITAQVLALTDGILPVILSGGAVSITGNTANVSDGYYRVANQQASGLEQAGGLEIPGYFYAPAANNLTVNNGQYIVARINVTTMSQYTTIISGSIMVVDAPTAQDVVLYMAYDDGAGITQILRGNDLQLITAAINKSNQLIINNPSAAEVQLNVSNQQVLILAIAENATVTLPDVVSGIYSIINNSTSTIYLMPNHGYTIFGKPHYLITPGSSIELSPVNANTCWIFL